MEGIGSVRYVNRIGHIGDADEGPAPTTLTSAVSAATASFVASSKAPATVRAYRADLRHFGVWCVEHARSALPATPATVADYLADLASAGYAASTITRRLSAISKAHQWAGYDSPARDPLVRLTASGIRRRLGSATRQARPILIAELRRMLATLPHDLRGHRDRAMLLIGFGGAMRRSELVALDVGDLTLEDPGLRIMIRRSKNDQEARGREVGVARGSSTATDPVAAVESWLEAAHLESGPLFRPVDRSGRVVAARLSDRAVSRIVQRAASRAGLDPERRSGHSLRAGFATEAAAAGAPELAIMRTTGHRSETMVRRYIRSGSLWADSAGRYLRGL